jgi:Mlc titration factor MtfA (ptsG expression regulator)
MAEGTDAEALQKTVLGSEFSPPRFGHTGSLPLHATPIQMWHWLRDHRRRKLLETPFPISWETLLTTNVAHYQRLTEAERKELRELVQVFIAEKNWEGCGGLALTDEIRTTIAAEACLMILALPHDLYRNVKTILVYPSTVVPPARRTGVFELVTSPLAPANPILGEAFPDGPVILVWDYAKQTARHPETGHNVVYHEFAHKLDMLDGRADGTPPLPDREHYREWVEVCAREFLRLRDESAHGRSSFLDSYGATNEAEFFAVITEQFFDRPVGMEKHHPDLYRILRDFYHQDPALRDRELSK